MRHKSGDLLEHNEYPHKRSWRYSACAGCRRFLLKGDHLLWTILEKSGNGGGGAEETDRSSDKRFEQIMQLYGSIMHGVAFSILKNDVDADEVVQETLFKMFRNGTVPDLDDEAIVAKLSAAVKNKALDFYTKVVKRQPVHLEDIVNSDDPNLIVPSMETAVIHRLDLQRSIEKLPDLQREYIQLRYDQDLSVEEIAKLKGKSEKSVYATLGRAIARLRVMMNE